VVIFVTKADGILFSEHIMVQFGKERVN